MRLAPDTRPTIPTSRTKRSQSGNFSETMFVTPDAPIDQCRCWPHSTSGALDDASIECQRLGTLLRLDCPRACGRRVSLATVWKGASASFHSMLAFSIQKLASRRLPQYVILFTSRN